MSETNRRRRALALALAIAALPFGWLVARYAFMCDDAYISFRYARHLVEGRGLCFNVGEEPPVEGYTNFLWVLWLAPFQALGIPLELVTRATSIACGALLVAATTRFAQRRLELGALATVATALFVATLPPLSVWSTSGLETMPFALCLFASFDALALEPGRPRPVRAGICALLAALLRADGAMFAGTALVAGAVAALDAGRGQTSDLGQDPRTPSWGTFGGRVGSTFSFANLRALLRPLALALAILVAGVVAHTLWRHSYYGEWIPNTAKIKAGFSELRLERGFKYLATMLLNVPGVVLALAAALAVLGGRCKQLALGACAFVAVDFTYAVFIGGDFMPMARFLVPAMPFVAVLFACAFGVWQSSFRARIAIGATTLLALVAAVLPAFDVLPVPRSWLVPVHFRWNVPDPQTERFRWASMAGNSVEWRALGHAIAEHTQPGESITLGNIGAVGYLTELYIYDVFGLTSREVADRPAQALRLSPGHDKAVEPRFYYPHRPTFSGAYFAPRGAPQSWGLPNDAPRMIGNGVLHAEDFDVAPQPGVAEGSVLRMMRFNWSNYHPRSEH